MAILTVQRADEDGGVTLTAASGLGDAFVNGPRTIFLINNESGAPITVTATAQKTSTIKDDYGLVTKADAVQVVEANSIDIIGPFPPLAFNDSSGRVVITYDGVTSLTVAAIGIFPKTLRSRSDWVVQRDTASGIRADLILDFAGAPGGQYFANGDENLSFDDIVTYTGTSDVRFRGSNGLIQTASAGTAAFWYDVAGDPIGVLPEEERENLSLWSNDWTDAAYNTKTDLTPLMDEVGADGVANSASSLLATANNGLITQAITDLSAARVYSVWVKRLVGDGDILMTQNGFTATTDVKALINSSTFTQVGVAVATVTDPVVGFKIVTSGDKIAVQYSQSEIGARPSSPITTTTVAVTREVTLFKVATADFDYADTGAGGIFVTYTPGDDGSYAWNFENTGSGERVSLLHSTLRPRLFSGTGFSKIHTTTAVRDVQSKVAVAWSLNRGAISVDGDAVETDTTGSVATGLSELDVGALDTGTNLNGFVAALVYYKIPPPDADLVAGTAP